MNLFNQLGLIMLGY